MIINPCYRCEHGTPTGSGYGYYCNAHSKEKDVFIEEGKLDGKCPDFDPINKPLDGECDIYGKSCATCSGCPAEPQTEEEESEVWG